MKNAGKIMAIESVHVREMKDGENEYILMRKSE